ncbi:hypothetical protein LCGC14_1036390 [marine sediment metagenome]|uniref:Uncharacterized protein n=1 Tax=marine sediment metagenome TaxID=412755 RepID=A0A0F9QZ68_9ZZZZ
MPDETGDEFLERMFEYEYCDECDGDVADHTAILLLGNWFACCGTVP